MSARVNRAVAYHAQIAYKLTLPGLNAATRTSLQAQLDKADAVLGIHPDPRRLLHEALEERKDLLRRYKQYLRVDGDDEQLVEWYETRLMEGGEYIVGLRWELREAIARIVAGGRRP